MTKQARRPYSLGFKAVVALAALRGKKRWPNLRNCLVCVQAAHVVLQPRRARLFSTLLAAARIAGR